MSDESNLTKQATARQAAGNSDIMQGIQDMIGGMLKDAVDKMQKAETDKALSDGTSDASAMSETTTQMDVAKVKEFVYVLQKFIETVNGIVAQLEAGISAPQEADETFLEGYMTTADNILEIAAFSTKDTLTGISNRYGFDNRLILEWNRAARDKSHLALLIFAPDVLAQCKDKSQRESLLKAVAKTLNSSIKRSTDFIARWSDDAFAVLLPITDVGGASIVAERIREEITDLPSPDAQENQENDNKLSVSIGVCVHSPVPSENPTDFVDKAYNAYKKASETDGESIIIDDFFSK